MNYAESNKSFIFQGVTLIALLALLFTFSGCGDQPSTGDADTTVLKSIPAVVISDAMPSGPGDLELGKLVYEKHCHYCHGRKGRGMGAVSIAVEPNPADFVKDEKRMAVSNAGLYKSITEGISKESGGPKLEKALAMPPFKGVLTPRERLDVITYIRELVKNAKAGNSQE